ncbi:unnamed protein product [Mytilus coruscus]|uniref:Galaxin-like repeats domain-containing protein n=1 Tax=Mytilus coruscus TaxID=42192 RepID=A0A6J8AMP0_MYTCO|nr:unnamed protein product [Mytilus coruscus]
MYQTQNVHISANQSFDRTTLQLREAFQIKKKNNKMNVCGCAILQNSLFFIADFNGEKVIMEYSKGGIHIRDIPVSGRPYDMTVLDNDLIANKELCVDVRMEKKYIFMVIMIFSEFTVIPGALRVYKKMKCGSNDYNPSRQTCCNGVVATPAGWSCCNTKAYNPELSVCCQDVINFKNGSSCCKDKAYHPIFETCCIDQLYPVRDGQCCGNNIYDPTTEMCCGGSINQNVEPDYQCCSDKAYSPASETCCFGKLFTPEGLGCCGDQTYSPQDETCCNGTVTEPSGLSCCGKFSYDPAEQTCCNGAIKESNFICFGNTREIISKYFVK